MENPALSQDVATAFVNQPANTVFTAIFTGLHFALNSYISVTHVILKL